MQKFRLVFWWLVSLVALGSALICLQTALSRPWLSYLYVASAIALVAGLIANPLARPRIGLGTRPIITLAMLIALTVGGLCTLLLVTDQAKIHGGTLHPPEMRQAVALYNDGIDAEAKGDYVVAQILYSQACTEGLADSCFNHGVMSDDPKYGVNDPEMARSSYRKACDLDFPIACTNLGVMLVNGKGGSVDLEGGLALFRQACGSGETKACANLESLGVAYDPTANMAPPQ